MRFMIDILHPAHVHFFRNLYAEMRDAGHEILVTSRRKDCAIELLDGFGIPHTCISDSTRGRVAQAREFMQRTARFVRIATDFKPDVLVGIAGPTIAVAGRILRRPAYVFYDTEFARLSNGIVYPLASKVVTPDCYQLPIGSHHFRYPGYHELAYLHPERFKPDPEVVREAGLDLHRPFSVVRFVGWWATHDKHERGLTPAHKLRLVRALEQFGPVVLSSEGDVPEEIADRVYSGPVTGIHHLLAFATLFYGESATMASEAAVLGTPAIYIATTGRGYTDDQARYGLVHDFRDHEFEASLRRARGMLAWPARTQQLATAARARLLADKVDVTGCIQELLERNFSPRTAPAEVTSPFAPDSALALRRTDGNRLLSATRR